MIGSKTVGALRRARHRVRLTLAPAEGPGYELWDCAVFLLLLVSIGYVVFPPTPYADQALSGLFDVASSKAWGALLTVAALVAVVCSYRPPLHYIGMTLVILAASYWSAALLVGIVAYEAPARTVLTSLIYGWIASRMWRERKKL